LDLTLRIRRRGLRARRLIGRLRGIGRLALRRSRDAGASALPCLQLPDLLLELAVAVLQLLVLSSELTQSGFELLDPHLWIFAVLLRVHRRQQCQRCGRNEEGK
jgi:hypothetical protein